MRRIGALAAAYDIPVIPHGGGGRDGVHFIMATTNSPWAEMFMPAPAVRKRSTTGTKKTTWSRADPKGSTCGLRTRRALVGILW